MSGEADLNEDGQILISETQQYTQMNVRCLSQGMQTPKSRVQNMELDCRLW